MPNIHAWKRGHWTYITVIALQLLITFTRELKCLPGAKSRRTWLILFLKKRLTGRGENIWYRFTDIIFLWATRLRKMNPWNLNRIDTNTKRIFLYNPRESFDLDTSQEGRGIPLHVPYYFSHNILSLMFVVFLFNRT